MCLRNEGQPEVKAECDIKVWKVAIVKRKNGQDIPYALWRNPDGEQLRFSCITIRGRAPLPSRYIAMFFGSCTEWRSNLIAGICSFQNKSQAKVYISALSSSSFASLPTKTISVKPIKAVIPKGSKFYVGVIQSGVYGSGIPAVVSSEIRIPKSRGKKKGGDHE